MVSTIIIIIVIITIILVKMIIGASSRISPFSVYLLGSNDDLTMLISILPINYN